MLQRNSASRGLLQRNPPPNEALDADGCVEVYTRAHVMQLTSIDSKEQTFKAALWLQLKWNVWLPPEKLGAAANGDWTPEVTFLNSEARPEDRKLRVVPTEDGEGSTLILTYTVKGVWHHRFDLRHFPLDTQTLVMRGVLWRSAVERVVDVDAATGEVLRAQPYHGRVRFVPEPCQLYQESFTHSDVWRVPATPVTCRAGHTDDTHRGAEDGKRFSTLDVEVVLVRKPLFYAVNVMFPFFLFVCLSFISFGVEIDAPGFGGLLSDRSSLTLNMVLTAAAFKMVVANYTPAVAYLTFLDRYILTCFVFMTAVAVQNYVVTKAPDVPTARAWNSTGALALSVSFAATQLAVPAAVVFSRWAARRGAAARAAKFAKREARRRQDALKYRQTVSERRLGRGSSLLRASAALQAEQEAGAPAEAHV